MAIYFCGFVFATICLLLGSGDMNTSDSVWTLNRMKKNWQKLIKVNEEMSRQNILHQLREAAGVYTNFHKSVEYGLNNTILLSVLSYNESTKFYRYKIMLNNWVCAATEFGYHPVVYVLVPTSNSHFLTNLESEFLSITFIPYPTKLFWSLLAKSGKDELKTGWNTADYQGDFPTFSNFGALVMLVPVYEILSLGFDALYLDIDVGMIRDPIPYMTRGHADLTISLELRSCEYPSRSAMTTWLTMEPNTGVMYWRHNNVSVVYFKAWLDKIIAFNAANDQKVMDLSTAILTPSCNSGPTSHSAKQKRIPKAAHTHSILSVCILNEFVFQTGFAPFHCARDLRDGTEFDYVLGLAQMGTPLGPPNVMGPVVVHPNYCDDKELELFTRGLWRAVAVTDTVALSPGHPSLQTVNCSVQRSSGDVGDGPCPNKCKGLDIASSVFGHWAPRVAEAKVTFQKAVERLQQGQLYKYNDSDKVYLLRGDRLRWVREELIPALRVDASNVTVLHDPVYKSMWRGKDVTRENLLLARGPIRKNNTLGTLGTLGTGRG